MEARADRRKTMAYEYVKDWEIRPYRSSCSRTLVKLRDLLNEEYGIITQFSLVGSGSHSHNLVMRNGNGPFDLDYNIIIIRMPEKYWNNLKLLKDTVRNSLNRVVRNEFFTDGKDSTSVITALLYFKDSPQVEFSFDIAILAKNRAGNYCRLVHDKGFYERFYWNEVPSSCRVMEKADVIKREGCWQEVRDTYEKKKNMYLTRWDSGNHPSFNIFVETINEVYNKHFC